MKDRKSTRKVSAAVTPADLTPRARKSRIDQPVRLQFIYGAKMCCPFASTGCVRMVNVTLIACANISSGYTRTIAPCSRNFITFEKCYITLQHGALSRNANKLVKANSVGPYLIIQMIHLIGIESGDLSPGAVPPARVRWVCARG